MTASPIRAATLAATLVSLGIALAGSPIAAADPAAAPDPGITAAPGDAVAAAPGNAVAPVPDASVSPVSDGADPASDACKQFAVALNFAATNYEDFAYNTAGGGNVVNYSDPTVQDSNVVGRTALRAAAATAWNASGTPGLAPEISAPMHSWSLQATKLLFVMGLHGGGDSLNNAANDLNTSAHDTQMACALAGTPAA